MLAIGTLHSLHCLRGRARTQRTHTRMPQIQRGSSSGGGGGMTPLVLLLGLGLLSLSLSPQWWAAEAFAPPIRSSASSGGRPRTSSSSNVVAHSGGGGGIGGGGGSSYNNGGHGGGGNGGDAWQWGRGGSDGGAGGSNGLLDWRLLAAAGAAALGWAGDAEAAHATAATHPNPPSPSMMAGFVSRNWPPRCLELVAPNSTVLDQAVLDHVTQALGIWGARLDKGKLRGVINALDQYYAQRGYIGSRVRTAYAHENGTVVLDVLERRVGEEPVSLVFVRPMKVNETVSQGRIEGGRAKAAPSPAVKEALPSSAADGSGNAVMGRRVQRQPEGTLVRVPAARKDEPPLVVCKGRTRAKVIAEALGLKKGQVFRLDRDRYRRLERLGPFDKAWLSLVAVGADGGGEDKLGVELIVQERPARALEPGLSKSLHTRDWNGDVYLEDRNWLGLNQALIVKLRKGLIQARKEPCVTMSAEFHDNPLKTGVLRAFSLYRDPVASDAIREGGSARFNLPLLGPIRSALEFTADRLLASPPSGSSAKAAAATKSDSIGIGTGLGATVTSLATDFGITLGLAGGRQDADISLATGLAFPTLPGGSRARGSGGSGGGWGDVGAWNAALGDGEAFSKVQLASTVLHPLPYGLHLALRSLSYWASRSVPPYLAYRMGGYRFYVRGYDDEDFPAFGALTGATLEARLPLMLMASGTRVGLSACAFLDYASGLQLGGLGRLFAATPQAGNGGSRRLWSPLSSHYVHRRDYASAGLGFRAGPIKIDWAVNHRWEGKVHISLVDPSF